MVKGGYCVIDMHPSIYQKFSGLRVGSYDMIRYAPCYVPERQHGQSVMEEDKSLHDEMKHTTSMDGTLLLLLDG